MLEFLCTETASSNFDPVFYLFVIFIVIIFFVIGAIGKKFRIEQAPPDDVEDIFEADKNSNGQLTERQRRYQNQLKQRKTQQTSSTHNGVRGSDHAHAGTVERYDSIVGSLGEVSDEGCDELDGVRLIVTDLFYDTDDDQIAYDYDAIGKSLVLGEVINTPRFKKPFGKR